MLASPGEAGDTHEYVPTTVNSTFPGAGGIVILVSLIINGPVVVTMVPVTLPNLNETLHCSFPSVVASVVDDIVNAENGAELLDTVKLPLFVTKSEGFVVI
jgi:hypothetical protein